MFLHSCSRNKMGALDTAWGQSIFLSRRLDRRRFQAQHDICGPAEHPFCRQRFCAPARRGLSGRGSFRIDVR